MTQSTATRRLVKSPPELWAELSSEDSLGRHLAEFGEVRITRVTPETTVAWEGDRASGTVELTPTGWGTKVVLTATPAKAPPDGPPAVVEAPVAPLPPLAVAEASAAPIQPAAVAEAPIAPIPSRAAAEVAPAPEASSERSGIILRAHPEPPARLAPPVAKRGFFARLFRKRQPESATASAAPEAPTAVPPAPASSIPAPIPPPADPVPPAPVPDPAPMPPPAPDPVPPTPAPQPPPPPQIEVLDPNRTVAILTEVLDDLGSAHHRPFSRD
jgi:hypothetical protein